MACAGLSGRGYVLISVSVVADSGLLFDSQAPKGLVLQLHSLSQTS